MRPKPILFDAVHELVGGQISGGDDLTKYVFHDGQTPPTEDEAQSKLNELINAQPMQILREQRNQKLAETDWWCCSDRTPTQAQLDYRQALRDLPSNSTPSLDEHGNLIGVTWPTKPTE